MTDTETPTAQQEAALEKLRALHSSDVIVLSKPSCVQCNATYRHLDSKGVGYEVFDLSLDDELLQLTKDAGYLQAPVVITNDDHWSGYDPGKIDNHVTSRAAA